MTTPAPPDLAAMMTAAEIEWQANAPEDWTTIDFRRWPRGFHRSAWVVAGHIGWNPLDVLDAPTPAARAVNALLTRLCVTFTVVMTRHTPDPGDPVEPLLGWFNAAVDEHKHRHCRHDRRPCRCRLVPAGLAPVGCAPARQDVGVRRRGGFP